MPLSWNEPSGLRPSQRSQIVVAPCCHRIEPGRILLAIEQHVRLVEMSRRGEHVAEIGRADEAGGEVAALADFLGEPLARLRRGGPPAADRTAAPARRRSACSRQRARCCVTNSRRNAARICRTASPYRVASSVLAEDLGGARAADRSSARRTPSRSGPSRGRARIVRRRPTRTPASRRSESRRPRCSRRRPAPCMYSTQPRHARVLLLEHPRVAVAQIHRPRNDHARRRPTRPSRRPVARAVPSTSGMTKGTLPFGVLVGGDVACSHFVKNAGDVHVERGGARRTPARLRSSRAARRAAGSPSARRGSCPSAPRGCCAGAG